MGKITTNSRSRRVFLAAIPALLGAGATAAQTPDQGRSGLDRDGDPAETRLPNGKLQKDEILKADYKQNLKEARELVDLAKAFELDLEKDDRFILSVSSLKKLEDMDKAIKRIRGRLRKF